ncbi:AMP-binding protein, partial [Bacillus velezensis]|uniref:AMP-binding protein n=1 Tax=Bacillus velezensis TaxID=492670 RepID=UPI00119EF4CE
LVTDQDFEAQGAAVYSFAEMMKGPKAEAYIQEEFSLEEAMTIIYTSGTTGNPKGVVHTHAWAYAHLRTSAP